MAKTYEEAIKEMAKELKAMWKLKDGGSYDYHSHILSGKASMTAFIFGIEEEEVTKAIMAEACK